MEILRFALGARFPLPGDTLEAAFEKECLAALLQALRPKDMAVLRQVARVAAPSNTPRAPPFFVHGARSPRKKTRPP